MADILENVVPRKDLPKTWRAASNGSHDPNTSLPFFHVVSKDLSAASDIFSFFKSPSAGNKKKHREIIFTHN